MQRTVADEGSTAAEAVAALVLQLLLPQTLELWGGLAEQLSGTVSDALGQAQGEREGGGEGGLPLILISVLPGPYRKNSC